MEWIEVNGPDGLISIRVSNRIAAKVEAAYRDLELSWGPPSEVEIDLKRGRKLVYCGSLSGGHYQLVVEDEKQRESSPTEGKTEKEQSPRHVYTEEEMQQFGPARTWVERMISDFRAEGKLETPEDEAWFRDRVQDFLDGSRTVI